jgi:hypothetical protein
MLTMQEDAMQKAFDKKVPYSEVSTLSTLLLADEPGIAPAPESATPEEPPAVEEEPKIKIR